MCRHKNYKTPSKLPPSFALFRQWSKILANTENIIKSVRELPSLVVIRLQGLGFLKTVKYVESPNLLETPFAFKGVRALDLQNDFLLTNRNNRIC